MIDPNDYSKYSAMNSHSILSDRHFLAFATISAVIAYIDSYVEKLIILDNAFISDSDEDITFDIDLGINLFDLIILTMRLMIEGIKIARLEKENVGN